MKGNLHSPLYLLIAGSMLAIAISPNINCKYLASYVSSTVHRLLPRWAYFHHYARTKHVGSDPSLTLSSSRYRLTQIRMQTPILKLFADVPTHSLLQPTRPPTCMHEGAPPRPAGSYPPLSPPHRSSAAIASSPTAVQMPCSEPCLTANSF